MLAIAKGTAAVIGVAHLAPKIMKYALPSRVPRVNVFKANMPKGSSKIKLGGTMDAGGKWVMPEFDVADSPIGKKVLKQAEIGGLGDVKKAGKSRMGDNSYPLY
jgi:hypothetical protein